MYVSSETREFIKRYGLKEPYAKRYGQVVDDGHGVVTAYGRTIHYAWYMHFPHGIIKVSTDDERLAVSIISIRFPITHETADEIVRRRIKNARRRNKRESRRTSKRN